MTDPDAMALAIAEAHTGIADGQTPFGAVVVRGGAVVASAHNTVLRDGDPTAHAEVNALRAAARALGTIHLEGCMLYSTGEPCPMCLAAIHWAKVDRVVFGASIADAEAAGFSELPIPARTLAELGKSPLRVEGGLLREECIALFARWKEAGQAKTY
jgi:tRNA(Arg) A34 adenosine deaminase TadA